ncbi:hypothetical protein CI102_12981 [Trichoderma harzianum]|nr:hypothetical protein CI102_12981 [Trichoderma harzianum]
MHSCTVELICLTGTRGLVAGWLCLASIPSHLCHVARLTKNIHRRRAAAMTVTRKKADAHRESRALHLFLSLSLPLLSPSRRRFTVVAMLRPSPPKCRNLQAPTSSLVPSPCPPPFALPNGNKTPPCHSLSFIMRPIMVDCGPCLAVPVLGRASADRFTRYKQTNRPTDQQL